MNQPESSCVEFEEVANCGGRMELVRSNEGVAMRVSGEGFSAWVQMGIALDGSRMSFWTLRGMDTRPPKEPAPMVPALLPADRTGLWGRMCPKCKGYFRTDGFRDGIICPYCDHRASAAAFTTENQIAFLEAQRKLWLEAFDGRDEVVIDLDRIAKELPSNRPSWTPTEYRQQFRFTCEKCKISTDILGDYGSCPSCGYRNSLAVVLRHLAFLDEEFQQAEKGLNDRHERERKWESLLPRYVSTWEAMANDIKSQFSQLPATPLRRDEIESLSFQQIDAANDSLDRWFAIRFLATLKQEDRAFLNRMINRRHLLVHKAGRVDEQYLRKTVDQSVKLHQRIRVRSAEIERLSKLLRQCSQSLFEGFLAIS